MLTLRQWVTGVQRDWPLVLAVLVGIGALVAQLSPAPGSLFRDGIPLVIARDLAAGAGLVDGFAAWPVGVLSPLYPVVASVAWSAWPVFPDGLTLIALMDAVFLAGGSWSVARFAQAVPTRGWVVPAALGLGFLGLATTMHSARAAPFSLCYLLGSTAMLLSTRTSRRAEIGSALAAAGAGLAWIGAAPLVISNAAVWAAQSRWQGGRAAMVGVTPLVAWLLVVVLSPEISITAPQEGGALAGDATLRSGWLVGLLALVVVTPMALAIRQAAPALGFGVTAVVVGSVAMGFPIPESAILMPWVILGFSVWMTARGSEWTPTRRMVWLLVTVVVVLSTSTKRRSTTPEPGLFPALRYDMLSQGLLRAAGRDFNVMSDTPAAVSLRTGEPAQPLGAPCAEGATHVGLTFPERHARWLSRVENEGARLLPLFRITDGPALYEVDCRP